MPAAQLDFLSTSVDSSGNAAPNHAEQGSTFRRLFTLYQGAITDPLMDLAPVTKIKMQVRAKAGGPVIVEASTDNGRITISSPTTLGQFLVNIPEGVMEGLVPSKASQPYVYDIKMYFADGTAYRYFEGSFEIRAEVTTDV